MGQSLPSALCMMFPELEQKTVSPLLLNGLFLCPPQDTRTEIFEGDPAAVWSCLGHALPRSFARGLGVQ